MENENVLAKGLCERIGIAGSKLTHKPAGKGEFVIEKEMPDHKVAVQLVLDAFCLLYTSFNFRIGFKILFNVLSRFFPADT